MLRKPHVMTPDAVDRAGFAAHRCGRAHARGSTAVAQLIASAALVVSIAVAATVVSIGIVRAGAHSASALRAHADVAIAPGLTDRGRPRG
jgi:hypothetical protein